MLLRELFEAQARKVVAVMPGGFHPFHPGHKSLYDWAVKTFGKANVYVAATNDQETRPFPFEVKKKLAAMAGVPESNFMQVRSPFNNREYSHLLDDDTALVFVRSEKDKNEEPLPDRMKIDRKTKKPTNEPRYLRSYTGKNVNTHDEMGYMAYGPTINFDFSGMQIKSASELRATWPEMSDEDKLKAAKLMYGNGAEVAVKLLDQALGAKEPEMAESIELKHNLQPGKYKHSEENVTVEINKDSSVSFIQPQEWEIESDPEYIEWVEGLLAGNDWITTEVEEPRVAEKAPPGREKQVKALKKKFDDPGAPYAIAWAQHNKKNKK